jgi:chromosome segregation ATPase
MFNPFSRRPCNAYFERNSRGQERIILSGRGRRHSHSGYRRPNESPEDADRGWDQDRRLVGENAALRQINQQLHEERAQLLRDNHILRRQLNAATQECEDLTQQNQRLEESERVVRRRLDREKERRREERAEREAEREAEQQAFGAERGERERELAEEVRRLREDNRGWGATVLELRRDLANWVTFGRNKEERIRSLEDSLSNKENRIRRLEYFLRREGYGGVR